MNKKLAEVLAEVFGLRALVVPDPATGTPMVVAHGRADRAEAARTHAAELAPR